MDMGLDELDGKKLKIFSLYPSKPLDTAIFLNSIFLNTQIH